MKIAKETVIIGVLGTIDLITTIIFIQHHGAEEANPIFRLFWNIGLPAFIAAKVLLTVCPLLVLEWARKRNPRFVQMGMRSAIAGYMMMYGFGFLHLNGPGADERDVRAAQISYSTEIAENIPPIEDTRMIEERERQEFLERKAFLQSYRFAMKNTKPSRPHEKHSSAVKVGEVVFSPSARLRRSGD